MDKLFTQVQVVIMPRIEYHGKHLWYSVYGTGSHVVLMLPGAIGTAKSDFYVQLDPSHQNCLDFDKFKFVFIEPHGWGRLNQQREYHSGMLDDDAEYCHYIMQVSSTIPPVLIQFNILFYQHLGHHQFSIYAWSEGAKIALVMARTLGPSVVRCMVLQAVMTYSTELSTKRLMWSRNVHNWDREVLQNYVNAYNGDVARVSYLWNKHMDYVQTFDEIFPNGILGPVEEGLNKIDCPTLLIHGDKVCPIISKLFVF